MSNPHPTNPKKITSENAAKMGSKGGKRTAENKNRRKMLQKDLAAIMDMTPDGKKAIDLSNLKDFSKLKESNLSLYQRGLVELGKAWAQGDLKACEFIADALDMREKESINIEIRNNVSLEAVKERLRARPDVVDELFGDDDADR